MSAIDDGGQAFPSTTLFDQAIVDTKGMTLRDWFAGQIILGVFADPWVRGVTEEQASHLAQKAFMVADAMLTARKGGAND